MRGAVRPIPRKGKGVKRILKEEKRFREKRKQGEKTRSRKITDPVKTDEY